MSEYSRVFATTAGNEYRFSWKCNFFPGILLNFWFELWLHLVVSLFFRCKSIFSINFWCRWPRTGHTLQISFVLDKKNSQNVWFDIKDKSCDDLWLMCFMIRNMCTILKQNINSVNESSFKSDTSSSHFLKRQLARAWQCYFDVCSRSYCSR